MFDYFYLADKEKAKSSPSNSAFSTPNPSRFTSPAVSRRPSMEINITEEVKVNSNPVTSKVKKFNALVEKTLFSYKY
jgi:hypothetical protein